VQNVEILIGGSGDDLFRPRDNRVGYTVFGGAGDDTMQIGHRNDVIFGEAGDDDIDGGSGSDQVEGGAGNDTIRSYDGASRFNGFDSLFGSDGNDTFLTDDGVADRLRGGPGNDSADVDPLDDVLEVETVT
jgi:Ca2+-binding RTX toxin-like protein